MNNPTTQITQFILNFVGLDWILGWGEFNPIRIKISLPRTCLSLSFLSSQFLFLPLHLLLFSNLLSPRRPSTSWSSIFCLLSSSSIPHLLSSQFIFAVRLHHLSPFMKMKQSIYMLISPSPHSSSSCIVYFFSLCSPFFILFFFPFSF